MNHNLNTSERHYGEICSTHTYQDRVDTLRGSPHRPAWSCARAASSAWAKQDADVVDMAFALRELAAESIPVNFLNPIDGTPLAGRRELNPRYCLKVLAMFRFANPTSEIRISGGRELHLGSLQPLGLYPANSIFVGDYLTTKGQAPEADYKMIEELGFEITRDEELACLLPAASEG